MAEGYVAGRVEVPVVPDLSGLHRRIRPEAERIGDQFGDDFSKATEQRTRRLGPAIGLSVGKGMRGPLAAQAGLAGKQAGQQLGRGLLGGVRPEMQKLTALVQKAATDQEKAARTVEAARRREADAAGLVRVAEARLVEVRQTAERGSARLAAAEERHAKALRTLGSAQDVVTRASRDQSSADRELLAVRQRLASAAQPVRVDVDDKRGLARLKAFESRLDRLARGRFIINLGIAASPIAVPTIAAAAGGLAGLGGVAAGVAGGAAAFAGLGAASLKRALEGQKALKDATKDRRAAVDDLAAAERAAADAAAGVADAQRSANRSVADATRSLAETRKSAERGVADAARAVGEAQKSASRASADAARALADAQTAAVERVADAERTLADTRRNAAAQSTAAQQQLDRAQQQLASSQDRVRTSLEALHVAREQAKRDLDDLTERTRDNALSTESAAIGLIEARRALAAAEADPISSALDLRKARLGVAEAEDRVSDARRQAARDAAELARAERAGVEGSDPVKAAKGNVADARGDVDGARAGVSQAEAALTAARADGARQVTEAERALGKARTDSARQVADAERTLQRARSDGAARVAETERGLQRARTDGARQVADAQRQLSRAQADGARQVAAAQADAAEASQSLAGARQALAEADRARGRVLAGLSPAQKNALAGVVALKAAWSGFLTSVEGPVLGALVSGMDALGRSLPGLAGFVRPVATAFGSMFDAFGDAASSPAFSSFASTFGVFAGGVIADATEGTLNLARGFVNLLTAFMPLSNDMSDGLVNLTKRFAAWSAGLADSKGFQAFVSYVRETGPLVLSVLGKLITAVVEVGIALAPMGAAMLRGLGSIASFVAETARAHPRLIQLAAGIGIAAAGGAALARAFAPVVALFRGAFSVLGYAAKGIGLVATAQGRATLQAKIWMGIAKAQIALTKVQTVVTRVFNAVLKNNPIGRVITVLALLVGGLVLAYKKSETFRNIVNGAWSAIRTGLAAAWGFIRPVLTTLGRIVGTALVGYFNTWKRVAGVVFGAVRKAISVWWSIARPIFSTVGRIVGTVLVAAFNGWKRTVGIVFNAAKTVIGGVWKNGIRPVFSKIGDGVNGLKSVFRTAVDGLGRIWDGLKTIFSGPVNWIIRNVINRLIGAVNDVSGKLGGGDILKPFAEIGAKAGAAVPRGGTGKARNGVGFSDGGWTGPGARLQPAGVVHADEFVVKKSSRRRMEQTNPGLLSHINTTGRLPGYALGGFVNPSGIVGSGRTKITRITAAQLALAEKLSGTAIRVMQGSFQPATSYSGTSHGGAGVVDTGPGNFSQQSWLRKVGFAAWGRNFAGAKTAGSGAHVHSVSLIDPGAKGNRQAAAYRSGGDGLGGRDYGPRPAPLPNLLELLKATNLTLNAGAGGQGVDLGGIVGSAVRAIRKKVLAFAGGGRAFVKGLGGGMVDTLGALAVKWAKSKAENLATKLSPALAVGKAVLSKMHGGDNVFNHGDMVRPSTQKSRIHAQGLAARDHGWTGGQWGSLQRLWDRESGFRWNADNPSSSAYGIPQSLPGSKMRSAGRDWLTNADTQIKWGLGYIKGRYGSPSKAWAHSERVGWYDRGGYTGPGRRQQPAGIVHADEFVIRQRSRRLIEARHPGLLDFINTRGMLPTGYASGGSVASLSAAAAKKADRVRELRTLRGKKGNSAGRNAFLDKEIAQAEKELATLRKQRDAAQAAATKAAAAASAAAKAATAKTTAANTVRQIADEAARDDDGQLRVQGAAGQSYVSARDTAVAASKARSDAAARLSAAQAAAKPTTDRLAAVNRALAAAPKDSEIKARLRKEHDAIVALAKKREKASSAAAKKAVQADIDAARKRQDALEKQLKTNADLLKQKKALEASSQVKALTAAQAKYTQATAASGAANRGAISAAEKLRGANVAAAEAAEAAAQAAQEAADAAQSEAEERAAAAAEAIAEAKRSLEEKVQGVRDVGYGLGLAASAPVKSAGGLISSLRRNVATVGTWGAVTSDLLNAGLRGPVMEEFINNGPSTEAVRFGRSLLKGGQLSVINGLQAQLRAEADRTGSIAEGYFKNPGSLGSGSLGNWTSATTHRPVSAGSSVVGGGTAGAQVSQSFIVQGMPADTSADIANKAAAKLNRELEAVL